MKKLLSLTFFLIFQITCSYSEGYEINHRPVWVNYIEPDYSSLPKSNQSYYYQLIDNQDNVAKECHYQHLAIKILNTDGLQNFTKLDFNYDPSYQKLVLHSIKIIRNGAEIDKLIEKEIKVLQREKNLERSIYDGSLNVILDLKDLRVGDIIDYEYSIIGFNPVSKGNYSNYYYLQYTFPINRIHCKILYDQKKPVFYKLFDKAEKPIKSRSKSNLICLEWNKSADKFKLYDGNVPYWLEIHPRILLSTYEDWEDVVNTFNEYYTYSEKDVEKILDKIQFNHKEEHQILSYIKLVQDEIRYLGFESGIGAYAPNNPLKVFTQRYGDCKDKSLLLVALLRSEGIESYPCLVNTQISENILEQIPSSTFDHCIVNFTYSGKEYFVDPTINNQGGDLAHFESPDYKAGLILKDGNNELTEIPFENKTGIDLTEIFECDSIGGSASYFIRTKYYGRKADNLRSTFKSNGIEVMQMDYLNYYNGLYNNVRLLDTLTFYDYERFGKNEFIIEEFYVIDSFWTYNEDSSILYSSVEPYVLTSGFNLPSTAKRTMPYQLGSQYFYKQHSQVVLPYEWPISPIGNKFSSEGFLYVDSIYNKENVVYVEYYYQQTKDNLEPKYVNEFLEGHEKINNNSAYQIQQYLSNAKSIDISYLPYVLLVLMSYFGIKYSLKLNRSYDPKPWKYAENKPIGGLIILPAIGVAFSPFYKTYQTIQLGFFNPDTWNNLINSNIDNKFEWIALVGLEQCVNLLMIFFSILIAVQFFQRRTSIPLLISIFYALNFIIPVADQFLSYLILPDQYYEFNGVEEYIGAFIGAAIWIPVFRFTEIVKSTFCKQLG